MDTFTVFQNWEEGQPDSNDGSDEDCLAIWQPTGTWHDAPCDWEVRFICENKSCNETFGENAEAAGMTCFEGMAYTISENRSTWEAASEICVRDGGNLAVISSKEINDFLWNGIKSEEIIND